MIPIQPDIAAFADADCFIDALLRRCHAFAPTLPPQLYVATHAPRFFASDAARCRRSCCTAVAAFSLCQSIYAARLFSLFRRSAVPAMIFQRRHIDIADYGRDYWLTLASLAEYFRRHFTLLSFIADYIDDAFFISFDIFLR